MSEWKPISEAPKDGTILDLWCVDPNGEFKPDQGGIRLTDCSWNKASSVFLTEGWVRILDDGDYDAVEERACNKLGLPAWKPTHFMLMPNPPNPLV